MINFYLPDFTRHYNLNYKISILLKEHPEYFYENIKIGAIYGCFYNQIWNGGRTMVKNENEDYDYIKKIINDFNSLNIPIRFVFTNYLINETHLNDEYCNKIMEIANNGMNEVVINSSILEKYLREKYPNFKYISSTTKCLLNNNEIIEESKKYYLTVLDFRKNIDFKFLNGLENKDKYELLINAYCDPGCQKRKYHYYFLSQAQLMKNNTDFPCQERAVKLKEALKRPTTIKMPDLYNIYYKELGFTHFKLEGRTYPSSEMLDNYLYYMVKPEYQETVKELLK